MSWVSVAFLLRAEIIRSLVVINLIVSICAHAKITQGQHQCLPAPMICVML